MSGLRIPAWCVSLGGNALKMPSDGTLAESAVTNKKGSTGGTVVTKKNKKESKSRTPARFAAGAQVRVKPGTTDPDFPDIPLGGWAGTIREVDQRSDPPTYLIEWNRHTLDHMHPVDVARRHPHRDRQRFHPVRRGHRRL
jgi:hypothetical protein